MSHRRSPSLRGPHGVLALLTLSLIAACGTHESHDSRESGSATLTFSAIPDQDSTELRERYALVAEHLSERLGVPVEYWHATDYTASVEAFKNGDVHLAWFGGVTGVRARRAVDGARAIAQGRVDPAFKSYFVANADTGIEPGDEFPVEMAGRTFTFGSAESTSGRLMPEFFLREATGQSPEGFFGQAPAFSGDHTLTAKQVESGAFECGALNYKVYDSMVASGKLDPARCVKVWTTPPYADYNWTAHPDLEEVFGAGFTSRLRDALVGITDAAVLEALGRPEGLIPAEDDDFAAIEETMIRIGRLDPR